jgi:PAS domain S-box-containing protein
MQQPEERLRILAEATTEGVVIVEHGRIIDVNDQYALMFRGDRAAFIGHEVVSFVAPEARALVGERIRLRSEETYEHRALRLDGTVFDVEVRGKEVTLEGRGVRVTAVSGHHEAQTG